MVLSTLLSFNTCITLLLSKYLGFGYTSHAKLPSQVLLVEGSSTGKWIVG